MNLGPTTSQRIPALLSAGTLALLIGGCTGTSPAPGPADGFTFSSPATTLEATPTPSPEFTLPKDLPAPVDVGAGEQKITELASQTQGASFGPMTLGGKTVVYLRCAGSGSLVFEMKGVGRFPMPCEKDSEPHGTRNVFDTRLIQQTTASVESSPGQIWSLGVYSEPIP